MVLDVRHELDDAGALGGSVDLEVAVALQAVRYRSEQGEALASASVLAVCWDIEALSPVPPCPLLHEAWVVEAGLVEVDDLDVGVEDEVRQLHRVRLPLLLQPVEVLPLRRVQFSFDNAVA